MMRALLVILFAAVSACTPAPPPNDPLNPTAPTESNPGANTPALAIKAFMDAIKAQDLDALALIWGSSEGPADQVTPKDQLRKRELIIQCYFQHDSYRIVSDHAATTKMHAVTLSVTKGSFTRETTTKVVLGPHDRWYVAEPDLQPLADLCSGSSNTPNN
jgi:hypothetical protein